MSASTPRRASSRLKQKAPVSNAGRDYVPDRVTSWGFGRPSPKKVPLADYPSWDRVPRKTFYLCVFLVPALLTYATSYLDVQWWGLAILYPLYVILLAIPILAAFLLTISAREGYLETGPSNFTQFFSFNDASLERRWSGPTKVSFEEFQEAYFDGRIDCKGDLQQALYHRYEYAIFKLTWNHFKFFLLNFVPEVILHSKVQDQDQVRDHYDRGNDFYEAFLGETMTYTSGIYNSIEGSLTEAQVNKWNLICNKIQMMPGEKHLDIGCGWGGMVQHAAQYYGTDSTGVTLAKEQTEYCATRLKNAGVEQRARVWCMDYRDIPTTTIYDKITCLEMAEHVGVRKFQAFLRQVSNILDDDGMFYLQIAGLRRTWQFEDFVWGLFMGKYVFPGADASCPLAWDIAQLEDAGFEIHSVENIGIHYTATIKAWYDNWISNKEAMVAKYGMRLYRIWEFFLAHSTCIGEQGCSTCWQIVCYKNRNNYDRKRFLGEKPLVTDVME